MDTILRGISSIETTGSRFLQPEVLECRSNPLSNLELLKLVRLELLEGILSAIGEIATLQTTRLIVAANMFNFNVLGFVDEMSGWTSMCYII